MSFRNETERLDSRPPEVLHTILLLIFAFLKIPESLTDIYKGYAFFTSLSYDKSIGSTSALFRLDNKSPYQLPMGLGEL